MKTKEEIIEQLSKALEEIIRIHDVDWSEKYRETELASAMADIARDAQPTGEYNDD